MLGAAQLTRKPLAYLFGVVAVIGVVVVAVGGAAIPRIVVPGTATFAVYPIEVGYTQIWQQSYQSFKRHTIS